MGKRRRRKRYPKRYCTLDFYKCIGYTKTGQGIVLFNNKNFYVDEVLEGEEARLLVYYEEDSFGNARAIKIKKPSLDRALELGHWKFSLGSYHLPHMSNQAQDAFKQKKVLELFPSALPIIVGKRKFYRNKVSLTNGGFMPPGRGRRFSVKPDKFDLMKLDLLKYKDDIGVTTVRHLKTEISGKPGTKIFTEDEVLGKKFIVSLDSFYQVNSEMSILTYKQIKSWIQKEDIVFDLFSGIATIGIHVSDIAKKVYSVEINKISHKDALKNIELNNIKNIEAICGDANKFIVDSSIKADVVILDPARAGLAMESMNVINNSNAKKIIYLSCNIDTQFRDISLLTNYKIIHCQPYDFFPQTFHVENLILLEKKD